MNERIKELVVKSGNGLMRDGKLYPHIGSRTQEDWEKFAELIVKECAAIDFYKLAGIGTEDDYNVAQVIKQHFGVEE